MPYLQQFSPSAEKAFFLSCHKVCRENTGITAVLAPAAGKENDRKNPRPATGGRINQKVTIMARKQPRTEFQRAVDDVLTEGINNNRKAREFILKNTGRMAKEIEDRFGSDLVQVYIKGKSSLKLMKLNEVKKEEDEKKEELGWSDFDNQIIINPYLPRAWWYEIFHQIHCYLRDEYLPSVRDTFKVQEAVEGKKDYKAEHMAEVSFGNKLKRKLNLFGPETVLKHAQKMQSHVLLCLGNEYLHPVNFFDNARTIFGKKPDTDIDFMSTEFDEANNFFPPSVVVLKDAYGKKVKSDSSIWINCSISKFMLYRLIVRYSSPGVDFNGKKCRDDINGERGKFRGEVIDISIPRRESEETINYWSRFKDDLRGLTDTNTYLRELVKNNTQPQLDEMKTIRVPGWDYQLQENIIMLHEVLTYRSGSAHKFYKRLQRAWPALEAIEQSSEQDKKSDLNSDLFDYIPELSKHYRETKKEAIKSFYKQLAITLRQDYYWDVLSKELKQELVVKFLPDLDSQGKHSEAIEQLLNDFNVVEGSKEAKTSANMILKDAFEVKPEDHFDSKEAREKAEKKGKQDVANYKELLRHLFIVRESNHAFGKKYHLSIEQIFRINNFRLELEACCRTGKKPEPLDLTFFKEESQQNSSLDVKPLSLAPQKLSSGSLDLEEGQQQGYGLNGKLTLEDVLVSFNREYIQPNFKKVLSDVDELEEPKASCYFCGIISSSLDLATRVKLFDVQKLGLEYFFPVVNLYLKCDKEQWEQVKLAYKVSKEKNQDPNQFIYEDKAFAPHQIRVIFIDNKELESAKRHDGEVANFEKELTTQRVNDRLAINTLTQTLDHFYTCLAAMNARIVEPKEKLLREQKKDQQAVERFKNVPERVKEVTACKDRLNKLEKKLAHIELHLTPLVNIFDNFEHIKYFVDKADKKGHIRDLLKKLDHKGGRFNKNLDDLGRRVVKYIHKDKTSTGKTDYREFGIGEKHSEELFLAARELRTQLTALSLNAKTKRQAIIKPLINHAKNLKAHQESLIFSRGHNDRKVLIAGKPFRILREPQINDYFHFYIGKTRDFYLLHWLDHKRTHYKSNITNFRTQLSRWIDMPESKESKEENDTH
ncbi:hypothetical protein SG34_024070 [Thalassomonas viridans]|uniref:Uncharacterized protein n=1 Tax=Thalassomonas viridans TaxID=137584 RepID=A0AAE9Z1P1_9GAMM|nr:hypothetical protein [Thalassomonas viridans]WDE04384.1 hypothetical protein SG34_024070 [Thalassomonas viridans]